MDTIVPFACAALSLLVVIGVPAAVVFTVVFRRLREAERRIDALTRDAARRAEEISPAVRSAPVAAPRTVAAEPAPVAPAIAQPVRRAPPPVPREKTPEPVATPAPAARRSESSLVEEFLGGRVLLVVGVIAVLFGIGFFLKLAIEREWIGPAARVAMGAAAGVALLVAGDRFRTRGFDVFGQALLGCGLGALYLCDYFSLRYGFYDRTVAFVLAGLVVAGGVVFATRRETPFLGWLAYTGAFLAPALLGSGEDALPGLTVWLVAVDAAVAATLVFRRWRGLDVFAAFWTALYYVGWSVSHFSVQNRGTAATCLLTLAGVIVLCALLPAALARRRVDATSVLATVLMLVAAYALSLTHFFPDNRIAIGLAALVVAAAMAGLAENHRLRVPDSGADAETIHGIAGATLAAAVPIALRAGGVAPAWAAFGAACVLASVRLDRTWVRVSGHVLLALAALVAFERTVTRGNRFEEPAFGADFFASLTPVLGYAAAWWVTRRATSVRRGESLTAATVAAWGASLLLAAETWRAAERVHSTGSDETARLAVTVVAAFIALAVLAPLRAESGFRTLPAWGPLAVLGVAGCAAVAHPPVRGFEPVLRQGFVAGLVAVAALAAPGALGARIGRVLGLVSLALLFLVVSAEIVHWGDRGSPGDGTAEDLRFRAAVVLSVFWAAYGAALVGAGFWRKAAVLRWAGMGVLLLTVAKVFLFDLARLDTASRIGSFLALGALLVAASFLYQRLRKPKEPPAAA